MGEAMAAACDSSFITVSSSRSSIFSASGSGAVRLLSSSTDGADSGEGDNSPDLLAFAEIDAAGRLCGQLKFNSVWPVAVGAFTGCQTCRASR